MKKAFRSAILAGILASLPWFSVKDAKALIIICTPNAPCSTDANCGPKGTGFGGICSDHHCICE